MPSSLELVELSSYEGEVKLDENEIEPEEEEDV